MGFQQGLSGLSGAQHALDATSNNVANAGTVGYKLAGAQFADVFAASLTGAGGNQIGIGTAINQVAQQFTQGNITVTNNPLDVAINGSGFFRMSDVGTISYTRNGQFLVDKSGYIVNAQGLRLTGYGATSTGTIVPGTPGDLQIQTSDIAPRMSTASNIVLNLDSRSTQPATGTFSTADPSSFTSSTSQSVFDSKGNPHTFSLYFVKTATAGQWDMYSSLDGSAPGAATALGFDSGGLLTTGMPLAQSFALTNGATTPLAFTLDMSGSTEFGNAFGVNQMIQDGYTSGRLSGISISGDGIVQGRYSNGQASNLGQIVLVNFNNPNGLLALGGNQWAETPDSGQALLGTPNTGSLGALQSAAVEESNVDLTSELVNMITQQRNYQANAQSIKTQDQMLQTLVNLR